MINIIVYYLLCLFHLFIMFLVVIAPLYITNTFYLLCIIILNIIVVVGWYLYGYCIFTDIENALVSNKNEEKNKKSFIIVAIEQLFPSINEKYIHNFISIIPFVSTLICCLTIYKNTYKCRVR